MCYFLTYIIFKKRKKGFVILSCVLVGMYFIPGSSAGNHFENSIDAFIQISNSTTTLLALLGNLFSIALFNFFGKANRCQNYFS